MKKIVFVAFVCLMTCTTYAQPEPQQQSIEPVLPSIPDGYVDLGLPSGTLWKDKNESGFYSYDQAVSQFGSSLPSQGQWEELRSLCGWTRTATIVASADPCVSSNDLCPFCADLSTITSM